MKARDVPLPLFAKSRLFLGDQLRAFCEAAAQFLPRPRVIYGRDAASPYLSRFYLLGKGLPHMPDGSNPFNEAGNPRPDAVWPEGRFGIYLHRFHRSDEGQELHDHPFAWSFSVVLAGGYVEERLADYFSFSDPGPTPIERRVVLPLALNVIWGDTYHRVDLVEKDAWTIFVVGPRTKSWGFFDRFKRTVTPWREHLENERRRAAYFASGGEAFPEPMRPEFFPKGTVSKKYPAMMRVGDAVFPIVEEEDER